MKTSKNPAGPNSGPEPKKTETTEHKSSFFDKVFEIARQVPKGRVTTYGTIAEHSGLRLSARMVGWAMHAAGNAKPAVPAHRVLNRNGMLTGKHHFATPNLMQQLLEAEGIVVENDKVKDFKKLFWEPGMPRTQPKPRAPRKPKP